MTVENPSGLVPVEFKILVKLDPVEERKGSIILADSTRERQQMAQTYATLVAVGGNAFDGWVGEIPKPGDRVVISKYAGQPPKAGDLEDLYRLATDKDIAAIVRK